MNLKKKKIIVYTLIGGALSGIAGTVLTSVLCTKTRSTSISSDTNKLENILPSDDQIININSTPFIQKSKELFKEFVINQIDQNKKTLWFKSFNIDNTLNKSIDILFNEIALSSEFKSLSQLNDYGLIQTKLNNIFMQNYEKLYLIFAKEMGWNEIYSRTLFDNNFEYNDFINITKLYSNMISVQNNKNIFNESIKEFENNEKFNWLKEQSNTGNEELNIVSEKYSKLESDECQANKDIYQEYIMYKHYDKYVFEYENSSNFEINFKIDNLNIENFIDIPLIIKKNSRDLNKIINDILVYIINNPEISYKKTNELYIKIINNEINCIDFVDGFIKEIQPDWIEAWDFLYGIIKNLSHNKDLFNFFNFISSIIKSCSEIFFINKKDVNYIYLKLTKNLGCSIEHLFSTLINLIDDFKNFSPNKIGSIVYNIREIIKAITGREINYLRTLGTKIYTFNFPKIASSIENILDVVNRNLLEFNINFSNEIHDLNKFINDASESLVKIADYICSGSPEYFGSSLGPLWYFINLIIFGPTYSSRVDFIYDPLTNTIFSILATITSPIHSTVELIVFCQENNINFWEWCRAHYKCIRNNWATMFDPLNWFHSCIKELAKNL